MAERLGEFGRPLLGSLDEHFGAGELFAKAAREVEGDGVVAAKRITASENESAIHRP